MINIMSFLGATFCNMLGGTKHVAYYYEPVAAKNLLDV